MADQGEGTSQLEDARSSVPASSAGPSNGGTATAATARDKPAEAGDALPAGSDRLASHGARPSDAGREGSDQPGLDGDETRVVTDLLLAWGDGNEAALDRLLPMLYSELHSMADRSLRRERSNHTLQATALVSEAYLRLVNQDRIQWRNRAQFLGIAAEMMRRILVDYARKRQAAKRDGGLRMTLDEGVASVPKAGSATREVNLVALDEALKRLHAVDPRQAKIVELRYFAGLKVEETAEVLDISARTIKREWQMARAWLKRELSRGTDASD